MSEIVVNVIVAVLSTILGAFLSTWLQRYLSRSPFARVIGMNQSYQIIIVVPYRNNDMTRIYVTYEDMLAANYAERALTLAGFTDDKIEVWDTSQFENSPDARQNNLVFICSSKSNPCTQVAFEKLKEKFSGFDAGFQKVNDNPEQWAIHFWGALFKSDSYAQQKELIEKKIIPGQGDMDDFALVIRAQNPWNPETKLLIIAGIRGIGTWGAARYIRSHIKEILNRMHGEDFAAIVQIGYRNYKIPHRRLMNIYPLTGPEQSQAD